VEGHGYAAGHQLALALATPRDGRTGDPDAVATADHLMGLSESLGLIERQSHDPSIEFCFFGVGGRRVRRGKPDQWSRPVEFGYAAGPRSDLLHRLVQGEDLGEADLTLGVQL
jgi:hypothetical protein